jgi:uncharacterized protein (TIGR02646 family)
MILIKKSQKVPAVLSQQGKQTADECCQRYQNKPADYETGKKKFRARKSIYGHAVVKEQLIKDQHEKCCFCEAKFTANSYGDVEHFRPKGGYTSTSKGELHRPGYYWLAYDWHNLYFSCEICNRTHKKNFFPLENETTRAKNHTYDLSFEKPAIIDPAIDDPDQHLKFNDHILTHKTLKGKNSIRAFGLNRRKIEEIRRDYLDKVELNNLYFDFDPDTITGKQKQQISDDMNKPWPELERIIRKARSFLSVAASNRQPFTLMVRQNFPHLPYEP